MPDNTENIRRIASFLWEVAQDLHGAVAKSENQNIIIPLTVLREKRNSLMSAGVWGDGGAELKVHNFI